MTVSTVKTNAGRLIFLLAAFILLGFMLSTPTVGAEATYKGVTPAIIIDVRTPAEFAAGHVKGAINIPVDRIGDEIYSVKGIGKDSAVLLYCRTGNRSERARQILAREGFTQAINGGGLSDMAKVHPSCTDPVC